MDLKCLKCDKIQNDCKCVGGLKIIFLFGKPVSKGEIEEQKAKSELEQIIDEASFLQKRIDEINQLNTENMDKLLPKLSDNE